MTNEPLSISRGDRLVAYADHPPRSRLYIEVTRVAKDRTWADIRVCNCYVMWTKRQRLDERRLPPASEPYRWDQRDLDRQLREWDIPNPHGPATMRGDQ
jgi:hypothetical protein